MIGGFNRSHRICLKKLVFSADIYVSMVCTAVDADIFAGYAPSETFRFRKSDRASRTFARPPWRQFYKISVL